MAEVSNELIFEVLKSFQQGQAAIQSSVAEVKNELNAIRLHSLGIQTDIKNIYDTLAGIEIRNDRIERRLGLVAEPAE